MEDTSGNEPRAKRQKKDKFGRAAAFEKLKGLKGSKNKCEIKDVNDVYEVVDEKEYTKRVVLRQAEDWIEDDGTGYYEDGRDIFDDDLDSESIAAATQSREKGSKKRKKAVSEQAGKGKLQYMLSNMPTKKKEEVKLDDDDVLSELISELDDTSSKSNIITPQRSTIKPKPMSSNLSFLSEKQAAKDYLKSYSLPKPKLVTPKQMTENKHTKETPSVLEKRPQQILKELNSTQNQSDDDIIPETQVMDCEDKKPEIEREICPKKKETKEDLTIESSQTTENHCTQEREPVIEEFNTQRDAFDDDLDMSQIEEFESQNVKENVAGDTKKQITEEQLLSGWETMQEGTSNESQVDVHVDTSTLPMTTDDEGKKVFRFFWWDAYEDQYKQPGTVFLFGKTYCESAKTYVSCCVAVRNIDRKIYLLPRTHYLDESNEPTDKPVALIDVYHEFNNEFAEELLVKVFKSRKVTKNYSFDPNIPAQSEYLEVRYSAKNPPMNSDKQGKTFSKVFGTNSSFLEIFLLERKIKGPCWLDITNPEPVSNPLSWCKFEVNCMKPTDVSVMHSTKVIPPPPLVVAAINIRTVVNPKTMNNEIVMVSCLVHNSYAVDKQAPNPPFQQHFCVLTKPGVQPFPFDIHAAVQNFKATKVQKMDSERALINYFITQFSKIDPDLIVGHDLQGYQISVFCERLLTCKITNFSRMSKIKRNVAPKKQQFERNLFTGRLVCDIKISAKELIKSRSFDLETLCQTVLKLKEGQRIEIEPEDVPKMYQSSQDVLKLVSLTMQDTAYVLKMMYELNVVPLALQITNIAGNIMSRTLLGGRSERNEFLLLHAFSEKDYIVPEKHVKKKDGLDEITRSTSSKKKPTYSGGLVLEPKVGFYDKLILLMDFNSLYPSIIQEYNICFTTMSGTNEDDIVLPDQSLPTGILPTEIRKLVESRRQVKQLMNNPDISKDLRMQYHIRQMALKLTANSMYGCLGFTNSRFYAKALAALVTHKGREILTNTKDLVQKMCYDVIYGDTDSIMINTNNLDYDQVMKIGIKIKQEVNKLYRQVELDIDGIFKYLLLLKKKKYAAVTLNKEKNGELRCEQEHKGLDIVRRDWSQLAAEAGRFILNHILSEQTAEERIENIHAHLAKLKDDLENNRVPVSLLVITKQLTKDPRLYADKNQQPHVQVALRYNQKGGKPLRAGDTVPYVICEDGTNASATQRAYHLDELRNSDTLKVDTKYYLAQQIHPVVSRLCEPIEGTDSYQIANCLGLDTTSFKRPREIKTESAGENLKKRELKFRNVTPFVFKCLACKTENSITSMLVDGRPFLERCANRECNVMPISYLPSIRNQLTIKIREFVKKYYDNLLICEDPACTNETACLPLRFAGKYPVCTLCKKGVMYKKYSEADLYNQLSYYQYIFDLSKMELKLTLDTNIENGVHALRETVEKTLNHSGYSMINLTELFSGFLLRTKYLIENDGEEEAYYEEETEEFEDF